MTTAQMWEILVPCIAAILTATAGYLKAHSVSRTLNEHLEKTKLPPQR